MRFDGFGADAFRVLQAIEFHQSREWFAENRPLYERQLREPLLAFCEEGAVVARDRGLDMVFDPRRGPFRINRDVRFSKDKRPYNTHVSAVLSADGTKAAYGVLYVHVGLERCFLAAGYWALPPALLESFRRRVVDHSRAYGDLLGKLSEGGLTFDREDSLKRMPRGHAAPDDPAIADALRLRGFTVSRDIARKSVLSRDLVDRFARFCEDVRPLFAWGSEIVT